MSIKECVSLSNFFDYARVAESIRRD
jgi:hypothetical protein